MSSRLLAGRGAGRGGSSSAVVIGRTIAGSFPIASTTSWANWNQEHASELVTCTTPLSRSSASRRTAGARSWVNVGVPTWSSTKASSGRSAARRTMVFTMLAPLTPHTHAVRTTVAAGPSASASRSPISLVRP